MSVWIQVRFCQCQNCIHCHGGGCSDPAVMPLLLARHKPDYTREVAVCEHCGICLLAAYPMEFEKIERTIPATTNRVG